MNHRVVAALLTLAGATAAVASGTWLAIEEARHRVRDVTADLRHVYMLRGDGTIAWLRRDSDRGEEWTVLSEDPENMEIEASEGALFVLKRDGVVWRLEPGVYGTAHLPEHPHWAPRLDRWQRVPGAEGVRHIAADHGLLYTLREDDQVLLHNGRRWWPITWNLPVVKVVPAGASVWILTEAGEVWRYLNRHPVRLERLYDAGDAVDVAGGDRDPFILTEDGRVLARERYPELRRQERLYRTVATGARGARLSSLSDQTLWVLHPRGEVWRYAEERWWKELDDPRAARVLPVDEILYTLTWSGRLWYRLPRRWPEIPNVFGTLDFAGTGAGADVTGDPALFRLDPAARMDRP